jgi:hypothetical protein
VIRTFEDLRVGGRATDFPAATGTIVAPLDCTEKEATQADDMFGLATCRRRHSKTLTLQASPGRHCLLTAIMAAMAARLLCESQTNDNQ